MLGGIMAKSNVQTDLQQDPWYLDPKRPESWGEAVSTVEDGRTLEELPVRLSVLVDNGRFAGLRGPQRLLDAIYDHYLVKVDPAGLLLDDPELVEE
jgi:hypothetical protein